MTEQDSVKFSVPVNDTEFIHIQVPRALLEGDVSKPVTFYMHGLAGTYRSGQSLAVQEGLTEAGSHVIAIDGHHSLNDAGSDLHKWRPADHEAAILAAIDFCKNEIDDFPEQYGVSGNSFGGYSALRVAIKRPEEVSHVLAVCPVTSANNSFQARVRAGGKFMRLMDEFGKIAVGADVPDVQGGYLTKEGWEAWQAEVGLFSDLHVLRSHNIPVHLIVGTHDAKTPVDHVIQLQNALPGTQLDIIGGADHSFTGKTDELHEASYDAGIGLFGLNAPIFGITQPAYQNRPF